MALSLRAGVSVLLPSMLLAVHARAESREYILSRAECAVHRLVKQNWVRETRAPLLQGARFKAFPHTRSQTYVIAPINDTRYLIPVSCITPVPANANERTQRIAGRFAVGYLNTAETSLGSTAGRSNLQALHFAYGYRRRYLESGRLLVDLMSGLYYGRSQVTGGGTGYPVTYAEKGVSTLGATLEPAVLWSDPKAEAAFGLGVPLNVRYLSGWELATATGVTKFEFVFGLNLVGSLRRGKNFYETRIGSMFPMESMSFSFHYGRLMTPLDYFD